MAGFGGLTKKVKDDASAMMLEMVPSVRQDTGFNEARLTRPRACASAFGRVEALTRDVLMAGLKPSPFKDKSTTVRAAGVKASEIETRSYMEKGERCLTDPDGYVGMVGWV